MPADLRALKSMGQPLVVLHLTYLFGVGLLAPWLAGCGQGARNQLAPTATADAGDERASLDVIVNAPDAGTAQATNDQAREIHVLSAAPDDFPKAVPPFPGARVLSAAKSAGSGGRPAWSVVSESSDSTENVRAYFAKHLDGFTLSRETRLPKATLSVWQSASYDVTVMVSKEASGATKIAVSAIER
jgi:hypothetical protein